MLDERIINKISKEQNGCWEWLGSHKNGYGQMRWNRRTRYVTHYMLIEVLKQERPTPKHMCLHSCDNPRCVNPRHIKWGTAKQNTNDMVVKGRQNYGGLSLGHGWNSEMIKPFRVSIMWRGERKKFKCEVSVNGERYRYIGLFPTREEARLAADKYKPPFFDGETNLAVQHTGKARRASLHRNRQHA